MLFNGVDIYSCKFFTINSEDGELKFYKGKFAEKTLEDFKTIEELKRVTAYCFWILQKKDIPIASKYCASHFLRMTSNKIFEIEKFARKQALAKQEKLAEETEELTKTTGLKYGDARRVS